METKSKSAFHAEPVKDVAQTSCTVEDERKVYEQGEAAAQKSV